MRNKKRNRIFLLLILLLGVTIGFAALATTLKINGNATITKNTWDIYWDNIANKSGVTPTTEPVISADENNVPKTLVTWGVTLDKPGDYYEFEVDAVNNGSLDAMITSIESKINNSPIKSTVNGQVVVADPSPVPSFIKYSVKYADGEEIELNHLLAKKTNDTPTRETYKIRVEYDRDAVTNSDVNNQQSDTTYTFSFAVTYGQADDNARDRKDGPITYITRQTEGQITPGDIIRIGETEDFYVISTDAQKTVLLAKYNLLVGNITEDWNIVDEVSSSLTGYCLQNENAVGGYSHSNSSGNVGFSATAYWENDNLEYSSPYPFVYDNTLTAMPDFANDNYYYVYKSEGYSIAYFVELYKTKLIEMGAPNTINGRLLKYEEANSAKTIEDNGTSIIFANQDYWLGSAHDSYSLWTVNINSSIFGDNAYSVYDNFGVRPVIEIATSDIQ